MGILCSTLFFFPYIKNVTVMGEIPEAKYGVKITNLLNVQPRNHDTTHVGVEEKPVWFRPQKTPSVWLRNGPVSQRCDCVCIRLQSRRGIKFIYRIHQESPRGILGQVLKLLRAVGFRWRPNTNSHEACALCRVVVWFARMGRGEALLGLLIGKEDEMWRKSFSEMCRNLFCQVRALDCKISLSVYYSKALELQNEQMWSSHWSNFKRQWLIWTVGW